MSLRILGLLFMVVLTPFAFAQQDAVEEEFTVGIDYDRVVPPLPSAGGDKVEVMELFWYGCGHCFQFEPYVQGWLKEKPDYVEFVRVPAVFNNPAWELHARAFYTAELLDVLDTLHPALFHAIHEAKQRLRTRDELKAFFAQHGVSAEAFDNTFDSFAVEAKLNRSRDLTRRSGINGVPSLIVAGRYRIVPGMAVTYKNLLAITRNIAHQIHEGNAP